MNDQKIRQLFERHLRGEISADELAELESAALSDGHLFEQLAALEHEAVDRWVQQPASAEHDRFGDVLAASPRLRDSAETAAALGIWASRAAPEPPEERPASRPSDPRRPGWQRAALAGVMAFLVALAFAGWLTAAGLSRDADQLASLAQDQAAALDILELRVSRLEEKNRALARRIARLESQP